MKTIARSICKQRQYSKEIKKRIISDFESGKFSVPQLGDYMELETHQFTVGSISSLPLTNGDLFRIFHKMIFKALQHWIHFLQIQHKLAFTNTLSDLHNIGICRFLN